MGQLDGVHLTPLVSDGKLTRIAVALKDCPGLTISLTAEAAREVAEAFTHILNIQDWGAYDSLYGVPGPSPKVPKPGPSKPKKARGRVRSKSRNRR